MGLSQDELTMIKEHSAFSTQHSAKTGADPDRQKLEAAGVI